MPWATSPVRLTAPAGLAGRPVMVVVVRSRQDQFSPTTAYGSVQPAKMVGLFGSVDWFSG
jgi:hypothetical protein